MIERSDDRATAAHYRWAFRHLDACIEAGQAGTYDMIILDPPKLAPNAAAVPRRGRWALRVRCVGFRVCRSEF